MCLMEKYTCDKHIPEFKLHGKQEPEVPDVRTDVK